MSDDLSNFLLLITQLAFRQLKDFYQKMLARWELEPFLTQFDRNFEIFIYIN